MSDRFATNYADLYEALDAANHSVSWTAHLMDIDPRAATIAAYEQALEYAARIRVRIGQRHAADMACRDAAIAA